MKQEKNGYYIYSIVAVTVIIGLFAFVAYLVYDLIIKLADKDYSNNTVIQALITLIVTVFIGGYFSKWLEHRNALKIELYKIRTDISLKVIDCASILLHHPESRETREILLAESSKIKLYFDDATLKALGDFINEEDKNSFYDPLVKQLKESNK